MHEGKTLTHYRNEGNTLKTRKDPSTKSYYRCLSCPEFRNICPGVPTRDMDTIEWCECVDIVMDIKHLSNAYVAKEADVSVKTIERIRAGIIDQDIKRSTARRVELVVFGSATKHICYLDFESSNATEKIATLQAEIAALREDVAYWKKENDRKAKIIDKYLE